MRRKLDPDEKLRIKTERQKIESAAFPDAEIEVVVDDFTYANGEPNVRVVRRERDKKNAQPGLKARSAPPT
jgi:hypothetical protein